MKKKILLATAVAIACGAPVAAMAGADIYGQFRFSVNSVDKDTAVTGIDDGIMAEDNTSLFGLKAEAKGDSVTAFVHLQTGANADSEANGVALSQRFYFGGLKGDFGSVAYGRMSTAYKMVGFKMDPFYNLSHIGHDGAYDRQLASYGLSNVNNGFTNDALQYTSPSMSGVTVNVGLYMDDSENDDHGTGVGVTYAKDGITAGVQLMSSDATATIDRLNDDNDAVRVHAGYKAANWSAALSYETVDHTQGTEDMSYTFLVGKYNVSKETELAMTVGMVDDDLDGNTEGSSFTLGAFQTVAPKTQVYVSFSSASLDNAVDGTDPSVFSLGAIHKF